MAIVVDTAKAKITTSHASAVADVFFSKTSASKLVVTHLKHNFVPGTTLSDVAANSKDAFSITATVPVDVPASDTETLKKWNFGFIQFQKISALTLYYAGASGSDGELSIHGNMSPAMSSNHGRDHFGDPNPPWLKVDTLGHLVFDSKAGLVTCKMGDHPMCGVTNELTNLKTSRPNYLRRMIDSRSFHTVFSALDPAGNYHHMAHVTWSCQWDYEFQWKAGSIVSATKTTSTHSAFKMDTPKSGLPADKSVVTFLAAPKSAPKLGTNEQSVALQSAVIGPPTRIDQNTYFGSVPVNFWTA